MSEENGTDNGVTGIKTPWGSITGKRTAEVITILLLVVGGVLAALYWKHEQASAAVLSDIRADMKDQSGNVVLAIKEFTKAQQDSTREQRVTNCLIALEPQERKGALDRCERIAR